MSQRGNRTEKIKSLIKDLVKEQLFHLMLDEGQVSDRTHICKAVLGLNFPSNMTNYIICKTVCRANRRDRI